MPFTVDKFLKGLIGKNKINPVTIIPQRFIQVFEDHGVAASKIPRLLPQIHLSDLKSAEALLQVLNHEVLDQAEKLFGVRSQWLEGIDDQIYEINSCYKHPKVFFEDLALLQRTKNYSLYLPVRAFTTHKNLDYTNPEKQLLALVLIEQVAILDDKEIFRYHIYSDEWDWSYAATRIQIKAMIRMVSVVIEIPVPLYIIKPHELQSVFDGTIIPKRLFGNRRISNPSLDDYSMIGYPIAKETYEMPEVLKYIEENQLKSLISCEIVGNKPSSTELEVASVTSELILNTSISGKRTINSKILWEPVRDAARTLWAESNLLSIAEVIRSIKNMSHLKGSGLTPSAIRKRIVDLAPNNIRGKCGRKSKKFT